MRSVLAAIILSSVSPLAIAQSETCPFKTAELSSAFGMTFSEGSGNSTPFPGGKLLDCTYKAPKGFQIQVSQHVAASKADALQVAKGIQGVPISADPDAAMWANVIGDSKRISLSYVRGNTHTQVSLLGANSKKPEEAGPAKEKLLKLRRVP